MIDFDSMEQSTAECVRSARDAYIAAALWSSCNDAGIPLDANYGPCDLADAAVSAMEDDVYAFLTSCWTDGLDLSGIEPDRIGHDLWLTRQGHGAGFWGRGLGALGDDLAARARSLGEVNLYLTDDGEIDVC